MKKIKKLNETFFSSYDVDVKKISVVQVDEDDDYVPYLKIVAKDGNVFYVKINHESDFEE